jgi:hypothetical protein
LQSGWDDKPQIIGYGQKRATVAKGSALNGESEASEERQSLGCVVSGAGGAE